MQADICDAIASRRLVAFSYHGHERVIEPHCHGTSAEGHELVRGFQVGGTGRSGDLGWKLFYGGDISNLRVLEQRFVVRADFNPADAAMHPVHCRV